MRSTSLVLAAVTGIAVSAFAAPAGALTPNSSTGPRTAAESVDPLATVHCRPYKHRSFNHGWGYGCGHGGYGVTIHRRGVVEEREGRRGRVEEREGRRGRVEERSRERTETRTGGGETKSGGGETKSGGSSGRGGTTGNRSGQTGSGSGGGGTSSGGGSSGQNSGSKQ
ncbi:MAG: hypothetical protein JO328_16700 [Hyphomicrobiales bacterium]|nr:hypothetical protein [Hyphomicrobiales bacterium]MBV8824910.1 hypothetical protein [Hyphomicrobiales bacterium]MBV9428337.1 hypothetical protein [Bradyrhizobiaceae bacterium]